MVVAAAALEHQQLFPYAVLPWQLPSPCRLLPLRALLHCHPMPTLLLLGREEETLLIHAAVGSMCAGGGRWEACPIRLCP